MPNHKFTVKPNEHGTKHTLTVAVPAEPDWAANGWDVQGTMLSAAVVKVQTAIRNNWATATGGNPEGAERTKALVAYTEDLFRSGGRTTGPIGPKVLDMPFGTAQEVIDSLVAQGCEVRILAEVEAEEEDN